MRTTILFLCLLAAAGCSSTSGSGTTPYDAQSEASRDTQTAERLNREAEPLLRADPESAEAKLRDALAADLFYGPAHNNLGLVYLGQGKLYEAASEFEWARKLLPGHPDPRLNLGITLERAGQVDGAIDSYKSALEVYPDHIPTVQALARLMARSDRRDEQYRGLLETIALGGESEEWRRWAREQSLRGGGRR